MPLVVVLPLGLEHSTYDDLATGDEHSSYSQDPSDHQLYLGQELPPILHHFLMDE